MNRLSNKIFVLLTLIIVFILFFVTETLALKQPTHRAINEHIADKNSTFNNFSLHQYLIKQLGLDNGVETPLNGKIVRKWLGDGGELEDSHIVLRYLNHFLDPVGNTGVLGSKSALEWALMEPDTQSGGNYSWWDTRSYYFKALTDPEKETKEINFAKTFRALGQVMHLVQDMSVPEHARKDIHPLGSDYEKWINIQVRPNISTYSPTFYIIDTAYPLSIKNLFDTDQYDGSNPSLTIQNPIGLSEYTNANYLSPDTIFTDFVYPAYLDMSENIINDKNGNYRLYLKKNINGETIEHFARAGNFYSYLPQDYKILSLTLNDDMVYSDYSENLIPRAIGYSSQALSYFFRGIFEIDAVPIIIDNNICGVSYFTKNMTQTKETLNYGGLFYPKYEPATGTPASDITSLLSDLKYNDKTFVPLWFDQSITISDNLATFRDAVCTLAYKGGLGSEAEAVIGKIFKLDTALYFNEEWYSLAGTHPWTHTTADDNPDNGTTVNEVLGNVLIKDNVRYADDNDTDEKARYNDTDLNLIDTDNPDGILITPSTYIEYKIDEISIENKPEAPPGSTYDYQVVWLFFNNDLIIELYYDAGVTASEKTAYWIFYPDDIMIDNIHEIFKAYGIEIPEPLYLESICFSQQLLPSPDSPLDTSQHMKVDYFRIIDGKTNP